MPSGWLANVAPGAPILSTWGNTIRDRTITVFDSIAQRDAQLPAPSDGMSCYVLSTAEFFVYDGTAWRPPFNVPFGEVAYAQMVTQQNGITTPYVDITGVSVTWTAQGGRKYVVSAYVGQSTQIAADGQQWYQIVDAANVAAASSLFPSRAGLTNSHFLQARISGGTGSMTRKLRGQTSAGSMNVVAGPAQPCWIRVDDVGPMGAPVLLDALEDRRAEDAEAKPAE